MTRLNAFWTGRYASPERTAEIQAPPTQPPSPPEAYRSGGFLHTDLTHRRLGWRQGMDRDEPAVPAHLGDGAAETLGTPSWQQAEPDLANGSTKGKSSPVAIGRVDGSDRIATDFEWFEPMAER